MTDVEAEPLTRGNAVGRYLVLEKIGDGAMGIVYAAYDPELDRKLALKLIRPELAGSTAAARLLREGRAIARLAHPNVVSVFDLGRHAGGVFVAMELVDGMSLAAWLGERARPWHEVLAVFCQAGTGLAAAHAAGIVHRDFKPVNVLVGSDGRVRVGDFGLAQVDADAAPARRSSDADVQVTQSVSGTPAYMAPEQFEGNVDAQSDQFSFAVALWEALYGERPYRGSSVLEIAGSIASARPVAPPASPVPSRVRDALLRALEPEPSARFPSMAELLAALAPRSRLPRGWPIALTTAIAAVAVVLVTRRPHAAEVCTGAEDELHGAWDVERRADLTRAFAGVAKPYAAPALAEVQRALDSYARDWVAAKTDSCTATVVRHVQTEEHQGLRDVCLAERLVDLKALVDVLAQADVDAVARGPQAVAQLPAVDTCANLRALAQAAPAPSVRAAPIEAMFSAADALADAGKFDRAVVLAKQAADDARAIGAHRLTGRALHLAGWLTHRKGDHKAAAAMLDDAIDEAEIARDDRTAAHAWVTLVAVVGTGMGRVDDGLAIARHASAALERFGGDPLEHARLDSHRGRIFMLRRQFTDALAAFESAHAIRSRILAADDLGMAESLDDLGEVYDRLDRFADSAAAYERVIAIRERKLGPDHPDLAIAYLDVGRIREQRNDYEGAAKAFRRGAEIAERGLGPDAPLVGEALFRLSNVLHGDSTIRVLERAIAILERSRDLLQLVSARQILAIHFARRRDYTRAEHELDLADAVSAQLGREHESAYWLARAEVYSGERRYDLAEDAIRRALVFDERVYGADSSNVATDHGYLGRLYDDQHRYEQALGEHVQQLAVEERVYGKDHAILSVPLTNIGLMLGRLGRYEPAIPYFTRALALDEKAFGKTSADLAVELWGLGDALEHLGRHADAIAVLERALALDNAAASEEPYSNTQLTLAIALWNAGSDRVRAIRLATDARAGFAKLHLADELAKADRWLASHG